MWEEYELNDGKFYHLHDLLMDREFYEFKKRYKYRFEIDMQKEPNIKYAVYAFGDDPRVSDNSIMVKISPFYDTFDETFEKIKDVSMDIYAIGIIRTDIRTKNKIIVCYKKDSNSKIEMNKIFME